MTFSHQSSSSAFRISVLLILLASCCSNAFAADKVPAFTARYGIEKFGMKLAEATYRLRHTDEGYLFNQETKLHGLASMFRDDSVSAQSRVAIDGDDLLLRHHRFIQTGKEKDRDEDFSIDWQRDEDGRLSGTVEGVVRKKPVNLTVDKMVWDMLSFQIPLMMEADRDTRSYPYYALLKGELDTYFFELTGIENISFAGKEYESLRLVRRNPEKKRELTMWLVPELHNMPFIVENMRDGKQHSYMRIESVSFDGGISLSEITSDNQVTDDEL